MASSQYYYSEMTQAAHERRRYQDKKDEYVNYKAKLENLNRIIKDSPRELSSASNSFLSGGFISDGEGLDKGALEANAKRLEVAIDSLSSVISKTEYEIEKLESQIRAADSEYESAKSAYHRALDQEEEERRRAAEQNS